MPDVPQTIGPYRMLRSLGLGGMGEVWLAHDERLDRQVAIKRIRTDANPSGRSRERFRREAMLSAQLNHPAIVQVYDVLQEEDSFSIVMEYVSGGTLKQLAENPLSVAQIVDFGRQIASGLAEAHELGVVHRDLKTENVLVTRKGQAKVADFGIAKRITKDSASASLTAEGAVIGTYRAMSPEQVTGDGVDHRSDLFSLGVLLYELLAGETPFSEPSLVQTLQRILLHHPPSVLETNPAIPEALSDLVDRLLEKDPEFRPRSAAEVVATLDQLAAELPSGQTTRSLPPPAPSPRIPGDISEASPARGRILPMIAVIALVVVLAAGAWFWPWRASREPIYVAVPQPDRVQVAGDEQEFDLVASSLRMALVRGLISLEDISVKDPAEVDAISGTTSGTSAAGIARAVAADDVLTSELDCTGQGLICRATVHRIHEGTVRWSKSFDLPTDDYLLATTAVVNALRSGYPDHKVRKGFADLHVSSEDFEEFLRLRYEFSSHHSTSPELIERLAALRDRSPHLIEAYLLGAELARRRFLASREAPYLEQVFELLEEARELAPGDPRLVTLQVQTALDAGQPDRAQQALEELETLSPGDLHNVQRWALLLESRGELQQAIERMRTAVARQPSWWWLHNLARMEYRAGDLPSARQHLEQILERSPGNSQGLSMFAQIELTDGDAGRAIELYLELLEQAPTAARFTNLGLAYLLEQRYEEAAEACRQAWETEPSNPFYTLNLADSESLLNRESASTRYREVIEQTLSDPDPSHWQMLTVRAQAQARLGEHRPAVASVQEALLQAPENSQVAYEAALVYALIGEWTSAQVHAKRALELGYGARWFSFPWFEGLREDPELSLLLQGAKPLDR